MALIQMKGVGYDDRDQIPAQTERDSNVISYTPATSLHPALRLDFIPVPRPDLLVIRLSDEDQLTERGLIERPAHFDNQENWRRTVGCIVKLGSLVNEKSVWSCLKREYGEEGYGLRVGDYVIIAENSGSLYEVKDPITNQDRQHRLLSPTNIVALAHKKA